MADDNFISGSENVVDRGVTLASLSPPSTLPGPTALQHAIGRYRIIRLLGEGGMGTVYEAEQDQPRRRVALKVIKSAHAGPEMLRRFQLESQTLGRLHHPGIAQIYEAGAAETEFGPQPFFAMEMIHGMPLIQYAKGKHLTTGQRLELIIKICEAVEHAHQRGIIHRDLKPGNILVDETGQPKILDFGVARVTDGDMQATRQTDMGQLLGTLAYMSPEQVLADPLALDTRSDVYALGVILYELLASKLPYTISRNVIEVVKTIQETDPAPLSSINRDYRGDIETIVGKALEKEKARRYGSAAELAADIKRFLEDRPIAARPASTWYQLTKFARRNKVLVTAVAALFLVLTVGVIVSTREAIRARRAERTASEKAAEAKAVNDFLQNDLLSQADSAEQEGLGSSPDPDVKVRTLLDRAAGSVQKRFGKEPLVESEIQQTIGIAYNALELAPEAEKHLRRAYELSEAQRGADAPETIDLLMNLSTALAHQSKYGDAVTAAKAAYEGAARTLGPENPTTVVAMQSLAVMYLYTQQYGEAEPLLKKALDLQSRSNGYDNMDTLNTSDSLAELYIEQARYAEARPLLAKGLESYRRVFGSDHPYTDREMFGLGKVLIGEGDYSEAEKVFSECLTNELRVRGEHHLDTLTTRSYLGMTYVDEGKIADGISLLENTLRDGRNFLAPTHESTLVFQRDLGWAYDLNGEKARAEQMLSSALRGFQAKGKDEQDEAAKTTEALGLNLIEQHKYAPAEPMLREDLAYREQTNSKNWQFFCAQSLLGAALSGLGKYSEAETLLLSAQQGLVERKSRMPADETKLIRFSEQQIVDLYSRWGKPEQAAQWRRKAS